MPRRDYVDGCPSCEQFKKTDWANEVEVYDNDCVEIAGESYFWVIIPSEKKSVETGLHLIFTTISHHAGSENLKIRSILTAEAVKAAGEIFGTNFRLVENFGGASTRDHFHVQLIQAGEGESLPRVIANIPAVISKVAEEHRLKPEAVQALLNGIMQPKK